MKSIIAIICFMLATTARAAEAPPEKRPAPLFDRLGNHRHPVSTASDRAQRYFDQGLTFCFAFNHAEAIRSFQAAAKVDPECAMAQWGIAYACGPHVNKPMAKEESDAAWAALQNAESLLSRANEKEQSYVRALAKRYQAVFVEDRKDLDLAYAAAMRDLARRYPDDLDAQVLFAEAVMDTMPWDYWTKEQAPKPETEEVLAALRTVMARNPDHPGANHLYIHAVEAGPNPESGIPAADRLARFAPMAGHLVHMPSHIYMRVGQYHEAIGANEAAVKADRSYLRECRTQGFYPGAYYPHNLHFLWWAQLFDGRSGDALSSARRAAEFAIDNYCGPRKAVEAPRLRHLPWLTLARFGRWDELLKVPEPAATNDFLVDRALWHFTRGLAFAATRRTEEAGREHTALGNLINREEMKKLDAPQFPVLGMLTVAERWLAGKAAGANGNFQGAIECLKQAAAAEDALPYMEPTYWPLPVRPALAAAHLKAGEAATAEALFREDLKRWPRNGWSLFGLEQALRSQGRADAADSVLREFERSWERADVKLQLDWF